MVHVIEDIKDSYDFYLFKKVSFKTKSSVLSYFGQFLLFYILVFFSFYSTRYFYFGFYEFELGEFLFSFVYGAFIFSAIFFLSTGMMSLSSRMFKEKITQAQAYCVMSSLVFFPVIITVMLNFIFVMFFNSYETQAQILALVLFLVVLIISSYRFAKEFFSKLSLVKAYLFFYLNLLLSLFLILPIVFMIANLFKF